MAEHKFTREDQRRHRRESRRLLSRVHLIAEMSKTRQLTPEESKACDGLMELAKWHGSMADRLAELLGGGG